jgi:hypothetical protein
MCACRLTALPEARVRQRHRHQLLRESCPRLLMPRDKGQKRHEATARTTFDEKSQSLVSLAGQASRGDVSTPADGKVKSLTAVCAMTSAGVLGGGL